MNHRSPTASEESRFQILLETILLHRLTDAEDAEFVYLVETFPELRTIYIDQVWSDTLLSWSFATTIRGWDEQETLAEPEQQTLNRDWRPQEVIPSRVSSPTAHRFRWIAVSMASFVFAFGWYAMSRPDPHSASELAEEQKVVEEHKYVAVLLDSEDAVWRDRGAIKYGDRLRLGEELVLESGLVRLAFDCGAGVVLRGPARLELLSEWRAMLHRGTFAAVVPEGAEGFTVLTPDLEVVDLGTKFGAVVDDSGRTEVQVYEGEVKLRSREDGTEMSPLFLRANLRPCYPQFSDSRFDITVPAVDSKEAVSVPSLEQLRTARTGQYPPLFRSNPLPSVPWKQSIPAEIGPDPQLPPGNLLGENFEPQSTLEADRSAHPWIADDRFARLVQIKTPLEWKSISGGHHAIELDGRDPAFPSVCPRLRMKLPRPLEKDFWFSFLGRYQGLDDGDFFGLWFDDNAIAGLSHSAMPNAGIRFGSFFARANFDAIEEMPGPKDNQPFFLVGHVRKNSAGKFAHLDLWVNPDPTNLGAPDLQSNLKDGDISKNKFTWMGIRMGMETELSDKLWLDRLLVGFSKDDVLTGPSKATSAIATDIRRTQPSTRKELE